MQVFDCKIKKWREATAEEIVEEETKGVISEPDIKPEPTDEDRLQAQVLYTALMTDTLLEE